ncbi:aminotransferase class V-fold PLP-dependent enzyme [Thermobifida halotolerans]|uniref:Aminotransferase class V-fold PLP-dependent enzyme n=1 Tax=Thermobifida halotolerans TaxID=483545 RepID=A0A399G5L7_9ACTN|nr:aminotransferase class V-fold PLP-dependent enzyme [Thermobifida halotolerans]UOE20990.1 aminotransferase class V-fold PLP-dependent enzyme [Thermobifida halotolerans]
MDIEALRRDTPGCAHRVHLNNAGAGLLSEQTLRAMTSHLELEAAIGGYEAADREAERIGAVYADIAELVGGRAEEVALFDSATRAWSAAFSAVALSPGDRILTCRAEYGSNALAYLRAARRTGVEIVVVPDDESGQIDTAALADLVDERTRLVAVSHVPTSGGLITPVAEIGRITRAAGVPFLLDATQSVGQFPVDVDRIGCDMLCATGRKFLRGPRGTGFLWVRTEALEYLEPHAVSLKAATWDGGRGFTWNGGARRFETWEMSPSNVLGLGAAVRQALGVGLDRIGRRSVALGARLRERLDAVAGLATHDLGRQRCAIVTATVASLPAADVAAALARHGVNVSVTAADHTPFDTERRGLPPLVRFSPHYYNTEAELDRAVEVVAALARTAA